MRIARPADSKPGSAAGQAEGPATELDIGQDLPSPVGDPPRRLPTQGNSEARRQQAYQKRFELIDLDHDGRLSESERVQGFDRFLKERKRFRSRVDLDGDGKISDDERAQGLARFLRGKRRRGAGGAAQSPAPSPTPL